MHKNQFSLVVMAAMLLLPGAALAYVAPEDVLFSSEFTAPPSARSAKTRVEEQKQVSADRRAAALQDLLHAAAPAEDPSAKADNQNVDVNLTDIQDLLRMFQENQPNDLLPQDAASDGALDDTLHGSSPDTQEVLTHDERVQQRILQRVQENQDAWGYHGSAGDVLQNMHGGAPLSNTGPGLVVLGTALLGGALWTVKRSGTAKAQRLS